MYYILCTFWLLQTAGCWICSVGDAEYERFYVLRTPDACNVCKVTVARGAERGRHIWETSKEIQNCIASQTCSRRCCCCCHSSGKARGSSCRGRRGGRCADGGRPAAEQHSLPLWLARECKGRGCRYRRDVGNVIWTGGAVGRVKGG